MRTRSRTLNTLVLAVPLALAVAACSGGGGTNAAGSSNAAAKVVSAGPQIVIGATLSLTGSLDASGAPLEAGSPDYATAAIGYAVAEVLTDALAKAGDANPGKLNQVEPPASGVTFDVLTAGLG